MVSFCSACVLALPASLAAQGGAARSAPATTRYLVVRSDDGGMSHSVNVGLRRLIDSGLPVSVSVMWGTPWYQETVDILRQHPEVAVGVHLTLNSEWKGLRWGPVLGQVAVPSLVDTLGLFFSTSEALHERHPSLQEVERELRAQIDRAKRSGLRIDYLDYHMGTVSRYPEYRAIAEKLAKEYGVGLSGYFGEVQESPQYEAAPEAKPDTLAALANRLDRPLTLLVTHVGIDDSELGALLDMNTDGGLAGMSRNRQGELDALMSPTFRDALRARGITLITYRQLIEMQGLKSMRRPGGE